MTDDAVKVGLLYVDTTALSTAGFDLDLDDVEGAYHALVDDLNASGGINGRQIDPVYTPVNPIGSEGAGRACVEVAEDEQVFIAAGLFLADAVLCLVETHQTAVIGGEMTPERLERAAAPWFTTGAGPDLDAAVLETMDAAGELEGPVAVLAGSAEEAEMTDVVHPLLDELGVDVVEHAVIDAPQDDPAATYAQVRTIAERFEAAGVESVIPWAVPDRPGPTPWPTSPTGPDSCSRRPSAGSRRSCSTRPKPTGRCWRGRSPGGATPRTRRSTTRPACRRASRSSRTPASRSPDPTRSTATPHRGSPPSRPARPWRCSGRSSKPPATTSTTAPCRPPARASANCPSPVTRRPGSTARYPPASGPRRPRAVLGTRPPYRRAGRPETVVPR